MITWYIPKYHTVRLQHDEALAELLITPERLPTATYFHDIKSAQACRSMHVSAEEETPVAYSIAYLPRVTKPLPMSPESQVLSHWICYWQSAF